MKKSKTMDELHKIRVEMSKMTKEEKAELPYEKEQTA